jgi:hypothetical protein
VRIRDEDKRGLERLRNALSEATGEKVTQQEALHRLVEFGLHHRDEFLSEAAWRPLTKKEIQAWMRAVESNPGWDAVPPDQIDDVVYGDG